MRPIYAVQRSRFIAIGAMAWLALPHAAAADERQDCEKLKGLASIEACTAVIEAGTYGADDLAVAYLNRGLENFARRDYDQAVADYSAAVALDGRNADKPDLIRHVLEQERFNPAGAVMIGDRKHDAIGAKANGLASIGVTWGYGSRQELLDAGVACLVDAPQDLPEPILTLTASTPPRAVRA